MADKEINDQEKFKNEINQLKALYEDPQPGLISWHTLERERLQTVFNLLHKNGFRPTGE